MTSEIRANKQTNRAGLGTVTYADTGIIVSGIVTCTELSGLTALNIAGVGTASTLDINGDIDVDGHTNLDNVSIAGVSTVATFLQVLGQGGTSDKGLEVRSNSTQNTDTNQAIRVRNNSNTDTFKVSYKGKVQATSFHGDGSNLTGLPVSSEFSFGSTGITTTKNLGINTSTVDNYETVGAANSFRGIYIGDGSLIFNARLDNPNGYYIGTGRNALNAGPITLGSTMTLDGAWVIV